LNIRRTIEMEGYVDLILPVVHTVDAASHQEAFAPASSNPEPLARQAPRSSIPIVGLAMTAVILSITRESWRTVRGHPHHH
jgi:hypothetical protein